MLGNPIAVFHGSAHPQLAKDICIDLGEPIGRAKVGKFSDGETSCEVLQNVRGVDCYIVQPTCAPTNDHLFEVLALTDALRRSNAASITAVMVYYGYARQDRRGNRRVPISAKLVADMLAAAGVNRVVAVDLHATQIEGFFPAPMHVENLYARPVLYEYLRSAYGGNGVVVVSPDAGGVERARGMAKALGVDLAIIDKRRERANESEVMHVIGDVKDKRCLVIDDMIDTAGTLVKGATALMEHGAAAVSACASHAVLSGEARKKIRESVLREVVVTDSIPHVFNAKEDAKFTVVPVGKMLAEAIRRIHHHDSVSTLNG